MNDDSIDTVISDQPFCIRRKVKPSECDSAGSVFAPNYYVYSLWALDALMRHMLGGDRIGVWTPVKCISFVHHSTLAPERQLDVFVEPVRIGRTSFDVFINGKTEGKAVFDANMTLVTADQMVTTSVPIPAKLRRALETRCSIIKNKKRR